MLSDPKSIKELKNGYTKQEYPSAFRCSVCGRLFETGEIFSFDGRFFEASRAITLHIEQEHPNYSASLICSTSKYNTLTENQQQLLLQFANGNSDQEIARHLEVSTSTVRHQKFIFREKAKQARQYLSIYESVFEPNLTKKSSQKEESLIPIHDEATMVDDRFVVTEQERTLILKSVFSSLEPLHLDVFPRKEKKKVVILTEIAKQFKPDVKYSEKDVNNILSAIYKDHVTLRRYLIEYRFMDRTNNCEQYWLVS